MTIYIDFSNPDSRLALEPTLACLRETGAIADWRACGVRPRQRRSSVQSARGALHAEVRRACHQRERAFYARARGIELIEPTSPLDATAATFGLIWLRRQGAPGRGALEAYLTDVLKRVWSGRMAPDSLTEVAAAVRDAGGETTSFESAWRQNGQALVATHLAEAKACGALDAPSYQAGDELYFGRQHLPVVRWWLSGQARQAPV